MLECFGVPGVTPNFAPELMAPNLEFQFAIACRASAFDHCNFADQLHKRWRTLARR